MKLKSNFVVIALAIAILVGIVISCKMFGGGTESNSPGNSPGTNSSASGSSAKFDAAVLIDRLMASPTDLQKDLKDKVITVTGKVRAPKGASSGSWIEMYGLDVTAYISCNPTNSTFADTEKHASLVRSTADFDAKVTDVLPIAVVIGTFSNAYAAPKPGDRASILLVKCEIVSVVQ